jgi:LysM repeat protein
MTRPESDGETPGWRIRRAKPSPTAPLLILLILTAAICGGAGYVLGSSGKDEGPKEVVVPPTAAPVGRATPLPITVAPQIQPTPVSQGATPLPLPTATPTAGLLATPGVTPVTGLALTATPGTPSTTGTPRANGTTAPAQDTYTVVPGDSLSLIAERQNVPVPQREVWVQALRTLNGIQGDNIQPGQVLRLPPRPPS